MTLQPETDFAIPEETVCVAHAAYPGFANRWSRCDPFTRNRGSTGDAWQRNLITDDLKRGEIPLLLVLRSLNAVRKESASLAVRLGRPSPDPGFGAMIELSGGDPRRLFNLIRIREALPRQGIAAEESPPALLQI